MSASPRDDLTLLLREWGDGDPAALDALVPAIYEELRRLAHAHMRREHGDRTLGTTALVHEAYLELAADAPAFENRAHFFGVASKVMRRVLIWRARARRAEKRGGGVRPRTLDPVGDGAFDPASNPAIQEELDRMLSVDAAVRELEAIEPRQVRVVECRYFTGLTIPETAEALGISEATVKREWQAARDWLEDRLGS